MVEKKDVKKSVEKTDVKKPVVKETPKATKKVESKPDVDVKKSEPVAKKTVVKESVKKENVAAKAPEHKAVEHKATVVDKKEEKPKRQKAKSKIKFVQVKSKRKTAIARAVVKEGKGRITINKLPYTMMGNKYLIQLLEEPVVLSQQRGDLAKKVDVEINVHGGGQISRIVAARGCIAKGLVKYFDDNELKALYFAYDRTLLVDDIRRKESKKQLGKGARAKKQQSKR